MSAPSRKERNFFQVIKCRLPGYVAAEARQPLGDVGRIADLAELAVAHDRYSGRLLLGHRILDGRLYEPLESGRIVGLAVVAGEQQRDELAGAREAPDVVVRISGIKALLPFVGSTYKYVAAGERLQHE